MTPEIRTSIVVARSRDYFDIMRTTIFALTAVGAVIHLGPAGYSAPLTTLVIATAAYGILAGGSALGDLISLRDDMDADMAKSAYGQGIKARNIPMLRTISSVLIGLIGLAELYAIFV